MNTNKIFYINILYTCNNDCRFCFSINTYKRAKKPMDFQAMLNIISDKKITSNDRVIINGGEPTLYEDLGKIIHNFKNHKAEVVLYSNGRKFHNENICEEIVQSNLDRITIPIHGNQTIHDFLTRRKNSFKETVKGINNLILINKQYNNNLKIEVKFIITDELMKSNVDLVDLLEDNIIDPKSINSIIFSGLVKTEVFKFTDIDLPNTKDSGKYVSSTIKRINNHKSFKNILLKFEDIPICQMDLDIQEEIKQNFSENMCTDFKCFYYYDSKYPKGFITNYKEETSFYPKCKDCSMNQLCGSILTRYRVLNKDSIGNWFTGLE